MEVQLQDLLEKIKKDGVDAAEAQSAEILAEAEKKAAKIVSDAEKKAQSIVEEAKQNEALTVQNTKSVLQQASRDIVLSIEKQVQSLFAKSLEGAIDDNLGGAQLIEVLKVLITQWSKSESIETIEVPEAQLKLVVDLAKKEVAEVAKNGIEIKAGTRMKSGFTVTLKGEKAHVDFSGSSMAEALEHFVSPAVRSLISTEG